MNTPVVPQQVKAFLLGAVGLLIAIYLGMQIGNANYMPFLFGAAVVIVIFVSFYSGRFFWVLTIASSNLAGTFPILGGAFTPFQILMAIGVAKFLVEDVVLRRTTLKTGNRFDLFLLVGFMGILTWHGVRDRFGMHFLGSNVWGGRNYVNVYVGLAAFFIIQSIPMKSKIWAKLPHLVLAVTGFDLAIAVITTVFPNSIFLIYPFYSAVSTAGVTELTTGQGVDTVRVVGLGNFGVTVVILVLASVSLRQLFSLSNLSRLVALSVGFIAVLFSSFRSSVFSTVVAAAVAGVRDLRWGVLALLPLLALAMFGLSVLNSVFPLPKQVQRSLAFLPGNWDVEMKLDVYSSNDFRARVWGTWQREFFPRHPLIGRGFGFRSEWTKTAAYNPKAIDPVQTVEVGNLHNGFFSTLDALGIVGTMFFVMWNVRLLVATFQVSFQQNNPAGFALRFLALSLATSIIFYWIGASSVGGFLPVEFALAGVFLRLQKSIESERLESQSASASLPHPVSVETA